MSSLGLHENGPFNIQKWMKEEVEACPLSAEYDIDKMKDGVRAHRSVCTHWEPHIY